jgi:aspartate beta-hydroxylase
MFAWTMAEFPRQFDPAHRRQHRSESVPMSTADTSSAMGMTATAVQAMSAGDASKALQILERALSIDPDNLAARLNYAGLLRAAGRPEAALEAITEALRVAPRSFHALLMKGAILDAQQKFAAAGRIYALAVAFAPPDDQLDRPTLAALSRAREVYAKYIDEFSQQVRSSIGAASRQASAEDRNRFDGFLDVVTGKSRVYQQQPTEYHFPGLPSIQFYKDDVFPWMKTFESYSDDILAELRAYLAGGMDEFAPYVQLPVGVPVDQWAGLNHSADWSSLFLKTQGRVAEENAKRFPRTLEALSHLPQPTVSNRSPVAMFSALQPRTRIPPHHGVSNTRLVLHLPLIVPDNCGFRVGSETRQWTPGKAWVFDDTIEHEAWNDSDELRVILIADIWSPYLSEHEREMYDVLMRTVDDFHQDTPDQGHGL